MRGRDICESGGFGESGGSGESRSAGGLEGLEDLEIPETLEIFESSVNPVRLGRAGRLWNARVIGVTGDIGDRDIQSLSVDAECWDILEFGEMGVRGFRGSEETGWQGSGGGERVGRIRGNRGIKRD